MRKLYETVEELEQTIKNFLIQQDIITKYGEINYNTIPISPRLFRVSLGVSKYMLSTWKRTQPEYFNLIKRYEDLLLGLLENTIVRESIEGEKKNLVPAMFVLKAYDNDLYNQPAPQLTVEETKAPMIVDTTNKSQLSLKDVIEVKPKEK